VRVAFLGNAPWSVPTLRTLAAADDIEVVLVVTNPPRPAGRGSRLRATAVADAARDLGLDVLETHGLRDPGDRATLRDRAPDAIVVVAYGELLSSEVLEIPRFGALNLHFSLLPRWRGAAPVQRAIAEGDEATGASVMLLDEGLDTGPVLATLGEPIHPDDDAGSLGARLAALGAPLVADALRSLQDGTAEAAAQDGWAATSAPKIAPGERAIDWSRTAASIERLVRALAPAPGAVTTFRGASIKVLRASASTDSGGQVGEPGSLRVRDDGVPGVSAADGEVALLEVAPAGRSRMSGADWARGARIEPGERCS
jgi:methionyl-tRNA formyltransferase